MLHTLDSLCYKTELQKLPQPLQDMVRTAPVRRFPKDKIVQYVGDNVNSVYLLRTGAVKIYDIDEQGNEKILHILSPFSIFPLAFYSGPQTKTKWFYGTLTDSEVYALDPVALRRAMFAHSCMTMELLQDFSMEVHELLTRLGSLGKTNSRDKVLAALTYLAVCHGRTLPDTWKRVSFPVSHQLVADIVGVTRESVAVVMKSLSAKRIIRNPRLTTLEINTADLFGLTSSPLAEQDRTMTPLVG